MQEGEPCPRAQCDGLMGYATLSDYFGGLLNCLKCGAPQVDYSDEGSP